LFPFSPEIVLYFLLQGANFRDLKGVKVGASNTVEWDPEIERVYLPSGKPLVCVTCAILFKLFLKPYTIICLFVARFLTMPCPSLKGVH
jgi:hypothetical protein